MFADICLTLLDFANLAGSCPTSSVAHVFAHGEADSHTQVAASGAPCWIARGQNDDVIEVDVDDVLVLPPVSDVTEVDVDDGVVLPPMSKVIDVDVDDLIEIDVDDDVGLPPVNEVSAVYMDGSVVLPPVCKVIYVDVDDVIEVDVDDVINVGVDDVVGNVVAEKATALMATVIGSVAGATLSREALRARWGMLAQLPRQLSARPPTSRSKPTCAVYIFFHGLCRDYSNNSKNDKTVTAPCPAGSSR
eukprot:5425038-Amphidinium_carterae.1